MYLCVVGNSPVTERGITERGVEMADEKVVVSGLLEREIRPLRNWCEWLGCWQIVVSVEEMFGLLHCGFNVPLRRGEYGEAEYDEIDRFIFYAYARRRLGGQLSAQTS